MKRRCLGCMELYDESYDVCPLCGFIAGERAEEAIHLEPGSLLLNRYIIGKVLGYGGFGVTYIGWDSLLEQKVAIKEYLPSEFSTRMPGQQKITVFSGVKQEQFQEGLKKFLDEARRLAKFQNESGIIKIFDSIETNGTAYIIMEYLEGETLKERLARTGPMKEDEAIEILMPIMESLKAVHNAGILHRDIAPENIFITSDGAKLIDFGASRYATTSHSRSLTVIVKPGYSPEEQYRSRGDQGKYTDVYSLAATLYKMVTGTTPPDAMERRAKFEWQKKDILVSPKKLAKSLSSNREKAILNGLNVKIDDRTPDIDTFIKELQSDERVKRRSGKIKKIDVYSWPMWLKIAVPGMIGIGLVVGILLMTGVISFKSPFKTEVVVPQGVVIVPEVEGLDKDFAIEEITASKLNAVAEGSIVSEYIEAGKIVLQSPVGASFLAEKGTVRLVVSAGFEVEEAVDGVAKVPFILWDLEEDAINKLEKAGLGKPIVEMEYDESVEAGKIIKTSIESGMEVDEGTVITITVSLGPAPFELDEYIDMSEKDAVTLMEQKGLNVSVNYVNDDSVPEGTVIAQNLKKGEVVKKGDTVIITVSSKEETFIVPDVSGIQREDAINILGESQFKVSIIENFSDTVPKDCVIDQFPEAGTHQKKGAIININISRGSQPFNVSFDPGDGYVDKNSITVTLGEKYGALPKASLDGYTFEGWYTSKSGGDIVNEDSVVSLNYSHTLYARWRANNITVTLDAKGGTVSDRTLYVQYNGRYDNLPTPVKTDNVFAGWFTQEVGGKQITAESRVTLSSNHTLYAHWAAKDQAFEVYFDANGGSVWIDYKTVIKGEIYNILPTPDKFGYDFGGWYTGKNSGTLIDSETIFNGSDSLTLYAYWIPKQYTVTFNANGGKIDGDTNSIKVLFDLVYGNLPTASRDGFTFKGWYTTAVGGTKITSSSLFDKGSDQTLYAQWESAPFTVTLNANGGTVSYSSISVKYGDYYGNLPTPTYTGKSFLGWFTSKDGGSQITSTSMVTDNKSHTLYAHWGDNSSTYYLYFDAKGGTVEYSKKSITTGSEFGTLPTPQKTGYTFGGWFNSSNVRVISSTVFNGNSDLTIYADWTPVSYYVELNPNGGWVNNSRVYVTYGENYGELPTPLKDGVEFYGWYDEYDNKIVASTTVSRAASHKLTAKWAIIKEDIPTDIPTEIPTVTPAPPTDEPVQMHMVYFDANGGSCDETSRMVEEGESIGSLPIPYYEGYKFECWLTPDGHLVTESLIMGSSDITLQAFWSYITPTHTLVFDANGGTCSESSRILKEGEVLGTLPVPERSGHTFGGWMDPNGYEASSSTVMGQSDLTLTAKWIYIIPTHTISFDPNGGVCSESGRTVQEGDSFGTLPQATRDGYTFDGWMYSDGSVASGSDIMGSSDVYLTAMWTYIIPKHTLTFDADGGTCSETSRVVEEGAAYGTLPIPEKSGYAFEGWLSPGGSIASASDIMGAGDVTLTALWSYITPKHTLTFDANGGTCSETSRVLEEGQAYGTLPTPSRSSYSFNGWLTKEGKYASASNVMGTADVTITASWTYIPPKHTITFDANGGTCSETSRTVEEGKAYGALPTPSRNGYTFNGWKSGSTFVSSTTVMGTGNVTLKADWTVIPTYTITFNANGGSVSTTSKTLRSGDSYGTLPTPTADYYTFTGWYTDSKSGTKITSTSTFTGSSNQTLYAHWSLNDFGSWSGWSSTYVSSNSNREVESREVPVKYHMVTICCGNSSGARCYLPYMQSGYTKRAEPYYTTMTKSEFDSCTVWSQGSWFTYDSATNGYIIGPGSAYCLPGDYTPWYVDYIDYETQYRYRDRIK